MVASQNLTGKARHSNEVGTLGTPFFYSNAYTEKEGILSNPEIDTVTPMLKEPEKDVPSVPKEENRPILVADRVILSEIASAIKLEGSVALDIETFCPRNTDGLNPWRGEIRLLSLKIENRDPWLIDLQSIGYDLSPLSESLESVQVIAHNLKFDALWLRVKCGVRIKNAFCTLTATRLLSAGTRPGNDLNKCLDRFLGIKPTDDHSTSDWGGMFLTDEQLFYAVRDVLHLHELHKVMSQKLTQAGLDSVTELEMKVLPVIVEMEAAGFAVNSAGLKLIRDKAKGEVEERIAVIRSLFGNSQLNSSSPAQLLAALAHSGINLPNTTEANA